MISGFGKLEAEVCTLKLGMVYKSLAFPLAKAFLTPYLLSSWRILAFLRLETEEKKK